MISPELTYLILLALVHGVLWVPVVIGQVTSRGLLKPEDYVQLPDAPLRDWAVRANRAHLNGVENFSPFAAIVLVAYALNYSSEATQILAAVFFWTRLAHAIVFIAGLKQFMVRTVIFTVSNLAMLAYGVLVLMRLV